MSGVDEVRCDWCETTMPRRETRPWNGTRFCRDERACDARSWTVQDDTRIWVWQILADVAAAATGVELETGDPQAVEMRVTVGNQVSWPEWRRRDQWWDEGEPTSAAQLLADLRGALSREMGLARYHLDAVMSHVTVTDVRVGSEGAVKVG